jgi:hypothetical protein
LNRVVENRRGFGRDVLRGLRSERALLGPRRIDSRLRRAQAGLASALFALALPAPAQPPDRELPTPTARDVEKARPVKKRTEPAIAPAKPPESTNIIVPLVMYTPETHVGFGGLFVHFFRLTENMPESRVSSLGFLALVTTRRQAIFEVHPDLYFSSDNFRVYGKLEYQRYPDSFWGIGNDTPDDAEERYERERGRVRAGVQQRFYRSLHAGLATDLMLYDARYPDPEGLFATEDVPGEDGGFTAGFGPTFTLDDRDNAIATHSGTLLHLASLWFSPLFGSKYSFRKLSLDARQFFPVTRTHTLGLHFYGETQGGDVPYYQLAMLGGDELLRGYYLGRYREKNLVALDLEYRLPIFWRFGAVAFAGAGQVASSLLDLPSAPVRWTTGGGLRFALDPDEGLNVRLDFGIGPGTYGFYFTAREAF